MFEAERIEDWIGTDVVDADGEKVGKLEDVFAESGPAQPTIGAIKTGAFGRKHRLVPLEGAAVGRDYVRVRQTVEQVKDSPEAADDGVLSAEEANGLYSYYGLERPADSGGDDLEAASAREDRRAEAEAASKRADELEEEAARQAERANAKSDESASAKGSADEAEHRRREAQEEADRLRAEAAQREG